ncbi:hypothetical protein [Burkholderia ubonensis]|uniref:hypothetical protein n=1 Tax=Burkholderia ubonensis TaxID=101571 RepID=UPI000ADD5E50|nr:hypothetical protein [Burkholderia ubonensis]
MTPISTVDSLFAGGTGYLPEGQRSGIFKRRITDSVRVEAVGISGDEQADPRAHGGPEKAVHHYAAENYIGAVPGLAPDWKRRLSERVKWAEARSGQSA